MPNLAPATAQDHCAAFLEDGAMRQRTRKLIGTALLLVFIPLYALFIMAIAGVVLPGSSTFAQTAFFFVTGLVWVLPAGAVITWMLRPTSGHPPQT
jgi:uncharacterized membrane protein